MKEDINPFRLDPKIALKKIQEFFQDPSYFPDLPHYIIASWEVVEKAPDFQNGVEVFLSEGYRKEVTSLQAACYNTYYLKDVQTLYKLLKNDSEGIVTRNLKLFQISPLRMIKFIEFTVNRADPYFMKPKWEPGGEE